MAISTDEIYATLNALVETCRDSEEGFRRAAEAAKNADLRMIFQEYREQRAECAQELRMEVARLGGRPEAEGSMAGALHRGWVNLKLAIGKNDDAALIAEAERGEEAAQAAYQKALKRDLPGDVRAMVERQFAAIQEAQAHIRTLELRRGAR